MKPSNQTINTKGLNDRKYVQTQRRSKHFVIAAVFRLCELSTSYIISEDPLIDVNTYLSVKLYDTLYEVYDDSEIPFSSM